VFFQWSSFSKNLVKIFEAIAYQRLSDEFGLTQEQIAEAVGKDRATVANFLRLLRLPEEIRGALAGRTPADEPTILALPDGRSTPGARRGVAGSSVRDTEALVRKLGLPPVPGGRRSRQRQASIPVLPKIGSARPTKARSSVGSGRNTEIDLDQDELNRLYEMLTSQQPVDPNRG
jgi:ParB family chromosome partitioning protein